jgi:hypothetical protein
MKPQMQSEYLKREIRDREERKAGYYMLGIAVLFAGIDIYVMIKAYF